MSPKKRRGTVARSNANMILTRAFTPTGNRRLNELIGFLVLIFAALLVLALVSYSPLDPSLNTAATPSAGRPTQNWIGMFGALVSDLMLQVLGIAAFLVPIYLVAYALRWFRSRPITAPYIKSFGALALLVFVSGFLGLLPWEFRIRGVVPGEGLLGRIVADGMIHYFNVIGAYLICLAMIAVSLYLSTAFSFGAVQIWSQTRFSFVYAALDRFSDWRAERARRKAARELEKKRAAAANAKPVVTAQLVPRRSVEQAAPGEPARPGALPPVAPVQAGTRVRSGIERMFGSDSASAQPSAPASAQPPANTEAEPAE